MFKQWIDSMAYFEMVEIGVFVYLSSDISLWNLNKPHTLRGLSGKSRRGKLSEKSLHA